MESCELKNPFGNDPFAMVWRAFQNLYPGKDCICYFDILEKNEKGQTVYGVTDFQENGTIYVFVDSTLKLFDAVEIFAHELAHVAVGSDENHGKEWEDAFDALLIEYHRIGDKMFKKHEPVPHALNGKACCEEEDEK